MHCTCQRRASSSAEDEEEIRACLLYLMDEEHAAPSSVAHHVAALRFLYSIILSRFALQIADRESVRIMSAAHPHSFFTDKRDSQRRDTVDCHLQVSFPGKRPHLVGAACGQVCGPRSPAARGPVWAECAP